VGLYNATYTCSDTALGNVPSKSLPFASCCHVDEDCLSGVCHPVMLTCTEECKVDQDCPAKPTAITTEGSCDSRGYCDASNVCDNYNFCTLCPNFVGGPVDESTLGTAGCSQINYDGLQWLAVNFCATSQWEQCLGAMASIAKDLPTGCLIDGYNYANLENLRTVLCMEDASEQTSCLEIFHISSALNGTQTVVDPSATQCSFLEEYSCCASSLTSTQALDQFMTTNTVSPNATCAIDHDNSPLSIVAGIMNQNARMVKNWGSHCNYSIPVFDPNNPDCEPWSSAFQCVPLLWIFVLTLL